MKSKSKWTGTPERHKELEELAAVFAGLLKPQAKELGKILADEYDISPPADITIAEVIEPTEKVEKTEFTVHLIHFGPSKLSIVKKVKDLTSLGLKESMELVSSSPVDLMKNISKINADQIKSELEELGAEIELR